MAEDAADTGAGGEGGSDQATAITDGVKLGADAAGVTNAQATAITDGVKPGEGDKAGEDENKASEGDASAPEVYEDFKVPEGAEVDKEALGDFHKVARELDLTQDQAQKLVDFQAAFAEKLTQQNVKVWEKMRTDWLAESKADKDIGGQNYDSKVESSKRALTEFGTPKLVEMLETFGLGNHPEIIRFTSRVGDAIGEDTIVPGGDRGTAGRTQAQRIFGKSASTQQQA